MNSFLDRGDQMLKQRRKYKRITQIDLASKLNVRGSYISELENHPEVCNPTLNVMIGLSKHLKLNPYKVFDYFIRSRKNHIKK
jgi:transcriptional regulator with XRE-family HTH domain